MPGEWLPMVWGGGGEDAAPAFANADQLQEIVDLIMQHYNAIGRDLHRGQGRYAPIFDLDQRHDDVLWELWIGGFERAVALRPESWPMILDSDDEGVVAAIAGLMTLVAMRRGESELAEAERDELTTAAPDLIPQWVETLNAWRLKQYTANPSSPTAQYGRPGRNEPCPCGSSKKYKKCCGLK